MKVVPLENVYFNGGKVPDVIGPLGVGAGVGVGVLTGVGRGVAFGLGFAATGAGLVDRAGAGAVLRVGFGATFAFGFGFAVGVGVGVATTTGVGELAGCASRTGAFVNRFGASTGNDLVTGAFTIGPLSAARAVPPATPARVTARAATRPRVSFMPRPP